MPVPNELKDTPRQMQRTLPEPWKYFSETSMPVEGQPIIIAWISNPAKEPMYTNFSSGWKNKWQMSRMIWSAIPRNPFFDFTA